MQRLVQHSIIPGVVYVYKYRLIFQHIQNILNALFPKLKRLAYVDFLNRTYIDHLTEMTP
jgi:hypothetical protein